MASYVLLIEENRLPNPKKKSKNEPVFLAPNHPGRQLPTTLAKNHECPASRRNWQLRQFTKKGEWLINETDKCFGTEHFRNAGAWRFRYRNNYFTMLEQAIEYFRRLPQLKRTKGFYPTDLHPSVYHVHSRQSAQVDHPSTA